MHTDLSPASKIAPPLPLRKAAAAIRLLFAGRRLDPERFAKSGIRLSSAEAAALAEWERSGLSTRVAARIASSDGSVRLVVALADGESVETVAMPVRAVCVSTQVGCAVACRFCASGIGGLRRNLTLDEILEQVVHARREMPIDRVVFMGMGEPSHNVEAVLEAVGSIRALAWISPRKQTFSTVGSFRALEALSSARVKPCLAFSLHSADEAVRAELLPHAAREPLRELVRRADGYGRLMGIPVQFEWTLLAGVNDGERDVIALCELLRGVRGYVNFIRWNPVDGLPFEPTAQERAVTVAELVNARGILATIRASTGSDVDAACGQLRRRSLPIAGG